MSALDSEVSGFKSSIFGSLFPILSGWTCEDDSSLRDQYKDSRENSSLI